MGQIYGLCVSSANHRKAHGLCVSLGHCELLDSSTDGWDDHAIFWADPWNLGWDTLIGRRLRKNIRQTFDQLEHHSRRIDLKKDLP
jgi:hypothetical protein